MSADKNTLKFKMVTKVKNISLEKSLQISSGQTRYLAIESSIPSDAAHFAHNYALQLWAPLNQK